MNHRLVFAAARLALTPFLTLALALAVAVDGLAAEEERRVLVLRGDGEASLPWALGDGYLGVEVLDLTAELRRHFGAAADAGVLIAGVVEGAPAADARLRVGDVLTAIDGEPIASSSVLTRTVRRHTDGDEVALDLIRDHDALQVSVRLSERERQELDVLGLLERRAVRRHLGPGGHEVEAIIRIDREASGENEELEAEALEAALGALHSTISGPMWQERLHAACPEKGDLEERIRELERRLEELGRELDQLPER